MTKRALRLRLIIASSFIVLCIIISLIEYISKYPNISPTFVGSNATLIALLFAAYIAYVFQQRGKFIDELRGWWNEIVDSKSDFSLFCESPTPTEQDYLKAFYGLSRSMDKLRLIYCNVGRSDRNPKGYYPFEQVRDIIDLARSLDARSPFDPAERLSVKIAIDVIFQSLRHAIQDEAGASVPDNPTLHYSLHRKRYIAEVKERSRLIVEEIRIANKMKR